MKAFKDETAETEMIGVFIIVVGIVVAAILTGSAGTAGVGLIANGTGTTGTGANSTLVNAGTATIQTWNTVSVIYALAFLILPIAAVTKFMK